MTPFSLAVAQSQQTQYHYDDLGRLKRADYDDDATQEYKYDAAGNRSEVITGPLGLPANSAPNAVSDSVNGNEDQGVSIQPLLNDSDPDNNTLTLVSVSGASNGTAVKSGNTVNYTPNGNWNGNETLTYEVSDGSLTASSTISITISAVNDSPNASNDSVVTNEDQAITFDPRGNDNDPDGDALTIASKTNGARGNVSIIGNTQLRYTPTSNSNGSDSFTYTVSDGSSTSLATVSVTVNAVNDPPTAQNDTFYNVSKSNWTTLDVRANDSDIDGTAFTITNVSSSQAQVQIINGGSTVRMRCQFCGTETGFTYTLTDPQGATDTAGVTVFLQQGGGGLPLF